MLLVYQKEIWIANPIVLNATLLSLYFKLNLEIVIAESMSE